MSGLFGFSLRIFTSKLVLHVLVWVAVLTLLIEFPQFYGLLGVVVSALAGFLCCCLWLLVDRLLQWNKTIDLVLFAVFATMLASMLWISNEGLRVDEPPSKTLASAYLVFLAATCGPYALALIQRRSHSHVP